MPEGSKMYWLVCLVTKFSYLYTNTVLGVSVRLFVLYRNHLPVVQFQN